MKSVRSCFKILAMTIAATATQICTVATVNANTAIRLDRQLDSIDIYVPPPERDTPGICAAYIEPIVDRIIEQPTLAGGKWAILVQSSDGSTLYSHNPDSYMIPASNMKLLVTAAALQKLDISGYIRSKSIREWIMVTNLRSNNAYADILLRYLGGSQSVVDALSSLGIDTNGYRLRDGSGLSRNNLITPRTLVSTLRAMSDARGKEVFFASLPVAGVSGTLKNRLRGSTAEGSVHAKTGTLRGVRALSGYIDHPEYGNLVFSIITNQPQNQSGATVVAAIDEIVLRLSTMSSCS
ncbi:D-alanyl-D-alanine carboxypeptidase/D-alanyl-D-alanine endopeptidase [Myxosarcina sp. GI1(2024)]